ncbi:deoxyribose-phosphate aldolase [Holotrichia oblita]|uniref:Deoxyribose-phosphate aldolase n=1 Tax=Holotrichia oblita TaxID=644536 RepID=A0ACB9TER8_HOLOL|nr:deoxyribose-phosphate aldolase [Holotrichia oblita]
MYYLETNICIVDQDLLDNAINLSAVNEQATKLVSSRSLKDEFEAAWLLKAITCIDLTTLAGDDTSSNVTRLCRKAARPLPEDLLNYLGFEYDGDCPIRTAAICVYPSKVKAAVETLQALGLQDKINVASVATGFPCGQTPLFTRLEEIKWAVKQGAKEIDIVIDRSLVLTGQWVTLFNEIKEMRQACEDAHMKAILAAGELTNLSNVYKASMVAMMAGADFIKTSTGKESINATIPIGIVMCRAIADYYRKTNFKVGLKPAGGIKTSKDAVNWLIMIKEILGDAWLTPELFRFGASGLLSDLEHRLYQIVTGKIAEPHEFSIG